MDPGIKENSSRKRSEILRLYERILEKRCKYCVSPMKRCIETGEILFPKITPVVLPGLEEMDLAFLRVRTIRSWITVGVSELDRFRGSEKIPKGESREDFIVRTMETFRGAVRRC